MSNRTEAKRELTRAERVRARRQAQQKKQKRKPSASQYQSHTPPVVKVNTHPAGNPFARPINRPRHHVGVEGGELTKPSVNRRITIPLNQQGAEIEFSTLPVMRIGWRLLSAAIAASALAAIIFLTLFTRVEAAQVMGLSPLLTSEVQKYIQLEGKPTFLLEPVEIQNQIKKGFPEIESITIDLHFPDQVVITAEGRQPQYAWVIDEHVYLIDTKGIFYPADPGFSTQGLIVVDADTMPEMQLEFERSEDIIVEILEYTQPSGNATPTPPPTTRGNSYTVEPTVMYALEQILLYLPSEAVLKYDERHGFGWQDQQGWNAYFGFDLEQVDMKIAIYNSIVRYINYQGIDATLISVEYPHAPYYRED